MQGLGGGMQRVKKQDEEKTTRRYCCLVALNVVIAPKSLDSQIRQAFFWIDHRGKA